jgi:predicted permease
MLPKRARRVFHLGARRGSSIDAETDEEIQLHLALRREALMARGMSREDAEAESVRRFGPVQEMRSQLHAAAHRRDGQLHMREQLDLLWSDVKYSLGQLRRAPTLTSAIIATFGLGIGANATMYGVLDRLLLQPPPQVTDPAHLVIVKAKVRFSGTLVPTTMFSYPNFVDFQRVSGFKDVAAQTSLNEVPEGRGAQARRLSSVLVTGNYFRTLGVHPAAGRFMTAEDALPPNGNPVAVISYGLWQRAYGGSPDVIGKSLDFGSVRLTIIGVAPKGFSGVSLKPVDAWFPITTNPTLGSMAMLGKTFATERNATWISIIARTAPGASIARIDAQATASLNAGQRLEPKADTTGVVHVESVLPLRKESLSPEARVASLLAVVAAFVLLIACANVANLLLARALRRRREIAVRIALGISRKRLIMQLLMESLLLAVAGGAAALVVAWWGNGLMRSVLLSDFAWPDAPINARLLMFTGVMTLVVGVASGILPALQSQRLNLAGTLRESAQGGGVQRARVRTMLLLTQGVLSVVLLIGTGLFVKSLLKVSEVDLGMDTERIVRVSVDLNSAGWKDDRIESTFQQLQDKVRAMPGLNGAALGEGASFGWELGTTMIVPGRDSLPIPNAVGPNVVSITDEFFSVMGMKILSGRPITADDIRSGARVAVVSEPMAKYVWPTRSPLGECIKVGADSVPCSTIVGVVASVHAEQLVEDRPKALVYVPLDQGPRIYKARELFIRAASGSAERLITPLRRMLQAEMPELPYANIQVMHRALDAEIRPWKLGASMFGVFGTVALLLTAVGLYSTISYTVGQRLRELGIRMALGAQSDTIFRLILSYGLKTAAVSALIGCTVAWAAGKLVEPMLFQVSPRNPVVYGAVVFVLLVVAGVASLAPAFRASRGNLLAVLRDE